MMVPSAEILPAISAWEEPKREFRLVPTGVDVFAFPSAVAG